MDGAIRSSSAMFTFTFVIEKTLYLLCVHEVVFVCA